MSRRLPLDPDGRRQRTDPSFQPGSTRGRIGNASPIGDGGGRGRVRPTSPGNTGPGGGVQFFDQFDSAALTVAGAQSKALTYLPLPYSEHVLLNGLRQTRGTDFTLTGQILNVLAGMDARAGDILAVEYAYNGGVPASPGGWVTKGDTTDLGGGAYRLTTAILDQLGGVYWPVALSGNHTVNMTSSISGGTKADGVAVTFLDAAVHSGSYLGLDGGYLGINGVTGVSAAGYSEFNGLHQNKLRVNRTGDVQLGILGFDPRGTKVWAVSVTTTTITVVIDGVTHFAALAAPIPASYYVSLTSATGAQTDVHQVSELSIT